MKLSSRPVYLRPRLKLADQQGMGNVNGSLHQAAATGDYNRIKWLNGKADHNQQDDVSAGQAADAAVLPATRTFLQDRLKAATTAVHYYRMAGHLCTTLLGTISQNVLQTSLPRVQAPPSKIRCGLLLFPITYALEYEDSSLRLILLFHFLLTSPSTANDYWSSLLHAGCLCIAYLAVGLLYDFRSNLTGHLKISTNYVHTVCHKLSGL